MTILARDGIVGMMTRVIRFILLITALSLGGCHTATGVRPMTVQVRDSDTQQPIEGADVAACSVHFFIPESPFWIIDFNPDCSARATTDAFGIARIDALENAPVKVVVAIAGYAPLETYLQEHPAISGPSPWIDPDEACADGEAPHLQVRFSP
jgi:hypothetical protein